MYKLSKLSVENEQRKLTYKKPQHMQVTSNVMYMQSILQKMNFKTKKDINFRGLKYLCLRLLAAWTLSSAWSSELTT